jgi:hypothetical protein
MSLSSTVVEAKPKRTKPYVVKDARGSNSCYEGDLYGPCHGRVIRVKNPTRDKWYVRVGCGYKYLQSVAWLPPGRSVEFSILWGGPGSLVDGQCRIKNLVRLTRKGKKW